MYPHNLHCISACVSVIISATMEPSRKCIFSYGSNSSVQLRARVENSDLQAYPARVYGWDRIFCGSSATWGDSGVGSLAPSDSSTTYGAAVYLTDAEVALLDRFEGAYDLKPMPVTVIRDNQEIEESGYAYISRSPRWVHPPTEQYLTAIHLMLQEQWGVDISRSIPVKGIISDEGLNVSYLYEWVYPGSHCLSLPALCVEVNAHLDSHWVMPRTIGEIVKKFDSIGIKSTAQLAVHLVSPESMEELNKKLLSSAHKPFHIRTLQIFKSLLGV